MIRLSIRWRFMIEAQYCDNGVKTADLIPKKSANFSFRPSDLTPQS